MRLLAAALALACTLAPRIVGAQAVFSGNAVVELTLKAPLTDLFDDPKSEDSVPATLSYRGAEGEVSLKARASVRGHSSREETECTFPKLKLRFDDEAAASSSIFQGLRAIKIGTHCGDRPDGSLTERFGRLANERAAHREAFVYGLLALLEVPTLRARPARITYIDPSAKTDRQTLTRDAVLVEDEPDAMTRLDAVRSVPMERFTSARGAFTREDTVNLAFAEALIGNFDWCLRMTPGDRYRCDAHKPLWNLLALSREDGTMFPLMYDFDLSGMVTGRHPWFPRIFNAAFDDGRREPAVEVAAQLQRARSLFTRAELDAARTRFAGRRADVDRWLDEAVIDDAGKRQIRSYLDPFFAAMSDDAQFYLPVVVQPETRVRADAAGARDACARDAVAPIGTPVSAPLERRGSAVRVMLLDAQWHWTGPAHCPAILEGPVWIAAAAIGTNYPK